MLRYRLLTAAVFSLLTLSAQAQDAALPLVGRDTGLALPRFASLKDDEVYVRAGPGQRYPIKFIYQRDGLPVQIVSEFGGWRKVRDQRGGEGWVYNALVSGARTGLVMQDGVKVRRDASENAAATAELSQGVIASLTTCERDFCAVKGEGFEGFVDRKALWGISPNESFEK